MTTQQPQLDRANTSFAAKLAVHLKQLAVDANAKPEYAFLKYYQNIVREYMAGIAGEAIDSRGLLLYWTMGLGKSIGAIGIAMDLIASGRQVIMLLTKSLQGNMREAIHKYIKLRTDAEPDYFLGRLPAIDLDKWIERNFNFVSMNASNMIVQVGRAVMGEVAAAKRKPAQRKSRVALDRKLQELTRLASLNGRVLIVDEAHNLFRAITNGSSNALALYDMVMASRDLRCVFLTGTPISNDPFELTACFNMLGSRRPGVITLPESYKDFRQYFVGNDGRIINRGKFQNRIMGLVSHVRHDTIWKDAADGRASTVEFPEELPMKVVRVPMAEQQYVFYQLARDKEREEATKFRGPVAPPAAMTKPKSAASSTYRVASRQLSNYAPPASHKGVKNVDDLPRITSPKFDAILANIDASEGLGLVYSQYTGVGGLGTFTRYLIEHGWTEFEITAEEIAAAAGKSQHTAAAATEVIDIDESMDDGGDVDALLESVVDTANADSGSIADDGKSGSWYGGYGNNWHGSNDPPTFDADQYLADIEEQFERNGELDDDTSGEIIGGYWDDATDETDRYHNLREDLMYIQSHGFDANVSAREHLMRTGGGNSANATTLADPAYVSLLQYNGSAAHSNDDILANNTADAAINDPFNLTQFVGAAAATGRKFAIISGKVDPAKRNAIKAYFNSPENKHGGVIDLLLFSSTGAEGLDLKNVRHIHIMEPYWTYNRLAQIKARGIRNESHVALPAGKRKVATYIYLAVSPHKRFDKNGLPVNFEPGPGEEVRSTDEELYDEAVKDNLGNESYHSAIQEVSLECSLIEGAECRTCAPTDEPLFTRNVRRDIIMADPCRDTRSEEVSALSIVVDGVTYYYQASPTSVFGWTVYEEAPELGGYRPMAESRPEYQRIVAAIENAGAATVAITEQPSLPKNK